jgi:hypothetical protein
LSYSNYESCDSGPSRKGYSCHDCSCCHVSGPESPYA